MCNIGIFFGTDTGNTEFVANLIKKYLFPIKSKLFNINNTKKKDIENFNLLFFGISTWYYGDMQSDWEEFQPILKKINFSDKKIAFFGCGDQKDYGEYFCDAIGLLYKFININEKNLIGKFPIKGYNFISSKALLNKKFFYGLPIDIDRQSNLTKKRIIQWINLIKKKINI